MSGCCRNAVRIISESLSGYAGICTSLLLRHYSDSSLLQTPPPPSYHKPISQRLLVIGFTFSSNFLPGQVGLLQLLSMSLLPCCRYHPAGMRQTYRPVFICLYCLRLQIAGSTSRVLFRLRGHLCVYLRYGLVTCLSPFVVTLSMGFRRFGYPPLCHSSYRASDFYPDRTISC